ncbi:hypothetical protein GF420_11410 [candidate division GN15 bacterium]|nr:hypothetical protein [candidate division GN15 bacterium]
MNNKTYRTTGIALAALLLLGLIAACGGTPSPDTPKKTVIAMFGAMERNDQAALAHLLDLTALMKETNRDYALASDSARTFTSPQQILEDLTNDGLTKRRWFSMQRIVNEAQVTGDAATVDVTFHDKQSGIAYLTKFGVHKVNDKWKIYSFKTEEQPS